MEVLLNDKQLFHTQVRNIEDLQNEIANRLNLLQDEYYLLSNGKIFCPDSPSEIGHVHIVPRLVGGKGGFGSMLRAIGAQIEKTTNREACRDLSGRRLRDINEEQRLKNWIATQADREQEAAQRKRKKLEKLCEQPKYEFKDDTYEKERSLLPEIVEDAVLQGFQASSSNTGSSCNGSNGADNTGNGKRKLEETNTKAVPKKKKKLWIDDEISSEEDCTDDEDEEETADTKTTESKKDEEISQDSKDIEHKEEISQEIDAAENINSLSNK